MSFIASAVISGGASLLGAGIESSSAQNAANAENQAATAADQEQQTMFNTEQANAAPWLKGGANGLSELESAMPSLTSNFTMQDFQEDPGYQFDLSQGEQAMQRSAAAKGLLDSVGTQQGLASYATGMASNEYNNAYQRFMQSNQQKYNMLSGLSNQGLQATGLINQAGMNAANNISANTIGAGNASAAASIGTGNAISNGVAGVANGYMNATLLNGLLNPSNPSNPNTPALNGSSNLTMPQMGSSAAPAAPNYGLGASSFGSLTNTDPYDE